MYIEVYDYHSVDAKLCMDTRLESTTKVVHLCSNSFVLTFLKITMCDVPLVVVINTRL